MDLPVMVGLTCLVGCNTGLASGCSQQSETQPAASQTPEADYARGKGGQTCSLCLGVCFSWALYPVPAFLFLSLSD
ncbi:unnamed protein product [Staurois parvus]|uniref:Lipoprotein n=1 Tax=Staurois parvus TaxID=386267 RepID=A0ABN9GQB5_9NEOB|nr:unnamed protein product [Staurois parvus]